MEHGSQYFTFSGHGAALALLDKDPESVPSYSEYAALRTAPPNVSNLATHVLAPAVSSEGALLRHSGEPAEHVAPQINQLHNHNLDNAKTKQSQHEVASRL